MEKNCKTAMLLHDSKLKSPIHHGSESDAANNRKYERNATQTLTKPKKYLSSSSTHRFLEPARTHHPAHDHNVWFISLHGLASLTGNHHWLAGRAHSTTRIWRPAGATVEHEGRSQRPWLEVRSCQHDVRWCWGCQGRSTRETK